MTGTKNGSSEKIKKQITTLYFRIKRLFLFAEETTPNFKDFLQPVFEVNRDFDHLCKAHAAEIGIKEGKHPAYITDSLNKAIVHLYRAFFDVADWLSVNLREAVLAEFKNFSAESIKAVIPEYYTEIRPKLEKYSVLNFDLCSLLSALRIKRALAHAGLL